MLSNDTASNVVAGDDEGLISVWDLRCLSGDSKPQGALTGHSEGISCLDSASNGWSIVSNSKDQVCLETNICLSLSTRERGETTRN